jgi:hypothetical protein
MELLQFSEVISWEFFATRALGIPEARGFCEITPPKAFLMKSPSCALTAVAARANGRKTENGRTMMLEIDKMPNEDS